MNQLLNRTENGKIFKCDCCNRIYIEYKNLNFIFEDEEYDHFCRYIKELDGRFWEESNAHSVFRRKIVMSVSHKNLRVLLNNAELEELKTLLETGIYTPRAEIAPEMNYCICRN